MQGKCYYCGKELTERTIKRHMKNCSEMKKVIEEKMENAKGIREQFLISIKDKKALGKYCIYVSIDAGLQLDNLDKFIRDVWVDCCGHLSAFYINKKEYGSNGNGQYKMNFHLKDILSVNQKFEYKYDFDSTTCLVLEVVDSIEVSEEFSQIEIIARNNEEKASENDYSNSPREGICKYAGKREAELQYLPENTKKYEADGMNVNLNERDVYEEKVDDETRTYTQQHIDDFIKEDSNVSIDQIAEANTSIDNTDNTNIFRDMFLKGEYSFDLKELIKAYPEDQINLLAENINLKLPADLNKAEAIEKYSNEYEEHMKNIMSSLNEDMYKILHKCAKDNGVINILDSGCSWNENKYSFLMNKGIIFPSAENGKPIFIMPQIMQAVVIQSDTIEFRRVLKKNSEVINIFTGMIEAYGILKTDDIIGLIKRYDIDIEESVLLSILEQSVFYNNDYYGTLDESKKIIFINNKIENYKEILNLVDTALDYKVFNKQELISIIQEDHLKKSGNGRKYIKEFSSMFVMEKDGIVENMKMLALEVQFRDSEEIVKDIINGVNEELDAYNEARISNMLNKFIKNIPLWKYKGATINEIQESNNAVVAEQKVGRNDPCPCGSGKKFKKCCG